MGLLFCDVTPKGVVMGSDSQDIVLIDNGYRIPRRESFRKDKILIAQAGAFKGLLGYVGTESIAGIPTRSWLEQFGQSHNTFSLADFCRELANELSRDWSKREFVSGLWIFVAGYEQRKPCFWYINNISSHDRRTGFYQGIIRNFTPVNDLEENYIKPKVRDGLTREGVLKNTLFHFRNGIISPFSQIYVAFNDILDALVQSGDPGFKRASTLRWFVFVARQRLEFVKRLYSKKHGIYLKCRAPIAGEVNVYAVNKRGEVFGASKESYQKVR